MIKKTLCSVIILGSLGVNSNTNAFALGPFSTLALYAGGACVIGETYRHLVNAASYGLGEFCNSAVEGVRNLGIVKSYETASKIYHAKKPIKKIIDECANGWNKGENIDADKLYKAAEKYQHALENREKVRAYKLNELKNNLKNEFINYIYPYRVERNNYYYYDICKPGVTRIITEIETSTQELSLLQSLAVVCGDKIVKPSITLTLGYAELIGRVLYFTTGYALRYAYEIGKLGGHSAWKGYKIIYNKAKSCIQG